MLHAASRCAACSIDRRNTLLRPLSRARIAYFGARSGSLRKLPKFSRAVNQTITSSFHPFAPLLPPEKGHFPAFLRAWRMSGRCSKNQISGQFIGKRSKNDDSGPREGTATVLSTHKALYIPRSMASKRDMMREALTRCTQLSPASIAMQAAIAALSPSTMKTGSMRILP